MRSLGPPYNNTLGITASGFNIVSVLLYCQLFDISTMSGGKDSLQSAGSAVEGPRTEQEYADALERLNQLLDKVRSAAHQSGFEVDVRYLAQQSPPSTALYGVPVLISTRDTE